MKTTFPSTQAGNDAYGVVDDGHVIDLQTHNYDPSMHDNTFINEASQTDVDTGSPTSVPQSRCSSTSGHKTSTMDDGPDMGDSEKLLARVQELERKLERTARELLEAQQHNSLEEVTEQAHLVRNPDVSKEESPAPPTNTLKSLWNNEIKRWKRVTSRHGSTEIYKASEKVEDVRARSSGYVLTVYDEYDHEGNRTHVSLEINSAPLLDLLRKVITYYPGDEFDTLRGLE